MPPHPNPFFSTVLNPPSPGPTNPPSTTTTPARPPSTSTLPFDRKTFSATEQSLQSRNKPFSTPAHSQSGESYESRQRRHEAAEILDSVELLMWFANARNESIPATRHHYQNILWGFAPPEPVWKEEYEIPLEERRVHTPKITTPQSAKGKERVRLRS